MKLHQFNILSEDLQYKYLLVNGVCIANRETEDNCILLFQVDDFYIELFFDHHCGQIMSSRSFDDTDELYPYLQQVDIPITL